MKKNNKGFFLAETIVMIALVTTVMAFVYPNVSKLYENYKNKTVYYDQTEDIYTLRAVYDYLLDTGIIDRYTKNSNDEIGCKAFDNIEEIDFADIKDIKIGGLTKLYITGYMTEASSDNYEFKKYLKRMKKTTSDMTSYRLIGEFEKGEGENKKIKYASIKIDNPNPNPNINCNLGGGSNETTSQ